MQILRKVVASNKELALAKAEPYALALLQPQHILQNSLYNSITEFSSIITNFLSKESDIGDDLREAILSPCKLIHKLDDQQKTRTISKEKEEKLWDDILIAVSKSRELMTTYVKNLHEEHKDKKELVKLLAQSNEKCLTITRDIQRLATYGSIQLKEASIQEAKALETKTIAERDKIIAETARLTAELQLKKLDQQTRQEKLAETGVLPLTNHPMDNPFVQEGQEIIEQGLKELSRELEKRKLNPNTARMLHLIGPIGAGKTQLILQHVYARPCPYNLIIWVPVKAPDEMRTTIFNALRQFMGEDIIENTPLSTDLELLALCQSIESKLGPQFSIAIVFEEAYEIRSIETPESPITPYLRLFKNTTIFVTSNSDLVTLKESASGIPTVRKELNYPEPSNDYADYVATQLEIENSEYRSKIPELLRATGQSHLIIGEIKKRIDKKPDNKHKTVDEIIENPQAFFDSPLDLPENELPRVLPIYCYRSPVFPSPVRVSDLFQQHCFEPKEFKSEIRSIKCLLVFNPEWIPVRLFTAMQFKEANIHAAIRSLEQQHFLLVVRNGDRPMLIKCLTPQHYALKRKVLPNINIKSITNALLTVIRSIDNEIEYDPEILNATYHTARALIRILNSPRLANLIKTKNSLEKWCKENTAGQECIDLRENKVKKITTTLLMRNWEGFGAAQKSVTAESILETGNRDLNSEQLLYHMHEFCKLYIIRTSSYAENLLKLADTLITNTHLLNKLKKEATHPHLLELYLCSILEILTKLLNAIEKGDIFSPKNPSEELEETVSSTMARLIDTLSTIQKHPKLIANCMYKLTRIKVHTPNKTTTTPVLRTSLFRRTSQSIAAIQATTVDDRKEKSYSRSIGETLQRIFRQIPIQSSSTDLQYNAIFSVMLRYLFKQQLRPNDIKDFIPLLINKYSELNNNYISQKKGNSSSISSQTLLQSMDLLSKTLFCFLSFLLAYFSLDHGLAFKKSDIDSMKKKLANIYKTQHGKSQLLTAFCKELLKLLSATSDYRPKKLFNRKLQQSEAYCLNQLKEFIIKQPNSHMIRLEAPSQVNTLEFEASIPAFGLACIPLIKTMPFSTQKHYVIALLTRLSDLDFSQEHNTLALCISQSLFPGHKEIDRIVSDRIIEYKDAGVREKNASVLSIIVGHLQDLFQHREIPQQDSAEMNLVHYDSIPSIPSTKTQIGRQSSATTKPVQAPPKEELEFYKETQKENITSAHKEFDMLCTRHIPLHQSQNNKNALLRDLVKATKLWRLLYLNRNVINKENIRDELIKLANMFPETSPILHVLYRHEYFEIINDIITVLKENPGTTGQRNPLMALADETYPDLHLDEGIKEKRIRLKLFIHLGFLFTELRHINAASQKKVQCIDALVSTVPLNLIRDENGRTLLHIVRSRKVGELIYKNAMITSGNSRSNLLREADKNGNTALHEAAAENCQPWIMQILEIDPSLLNIANNAGFTPALLACRYGNNEALALFLEEIHKSRRPSRTKGMENHPPLKLLSEHQLPNKDTAMDLAAASGHVDTVAILLREGLPYMPLEGTSERQERVWPIDTAQEKGHWELVRLFLEQDLDQVCNTHFHKGYSPMHRTVIEDQEHNGISALDVFFKAGANLQVQALNNGMNVLCLALKYGAQQALNYLEQLYDNPETRHIVTDLAKTANHKGKYALSYAIKRASSPHKSERPSASFLTKLVEISSIRGIPIADMKESKSGRTPLMQACHFGNVAVVELLITHSHPRLKLHTRTQENHTALSLALRAGHEAVAMVLVSTELDPIQATLAQLDSDKREFEDTVNANNDKMKSGIDEINSKEKKFESKLVTRIPQDGIPPIYDAVRLAERSGSTELIKRMLILGADPFELVKGEHLNPEIRVGESAQERSIRLNHREINICINTHNRVARSRNERQTTIAKRHANAFNAAIVHLENKAIALYKGSASFDDICIDLLRCISLEPKETRGYRLLFNLLFYPQSISKYAQQLCAFENILGTFTIAPEPRVILNAIVAQIKGPNAYAIIKASPSNAENFPFAHVMYFHAYRRNPTNSSPENETEERDDNNWVSEMDSYLTQVNTISSMPDLIVAKAETKLRLGDTQEALAIIDRYPTEQSHLPLFLKAQILESTQHKTEAKEAYEYCLSKNLDHERYFLYEKNELVDCRHVALYEEKYPLSIPRLNETLLSFYPLGVNINLRALAYRQCISLAENGDERCLYMNRFETYVNDREFSFFTLLTFIHTALEQNQPDMAHKQFIKHKEGLRSLDPYIMHYYDAEIEWMQHQQRESTETAELAPDIENKFRKAEQSPAKSLIYDRLYALTKNRTYILEETLSTPISEMERGPLIRTHNNYTIRSQHGEIWQCENRAKALIAITLKVTDIQSRLLEFEEYRTMNSQKIATAVIRHWINSFMSLTGTERTQYIGKNPDQVLDLFCMPLDSIKVQENGLDEELLIEASSSLQLFIASLETEGLAIILRTQNRREKILRLIILLYSWNMQTRNVITEISIEELFIALKQKSHLNNWPEKDITAVLARFSTNPTTEEETEDDTTRISRVSMLPTESELKQLIPKTVVLRKRPRAGSASGTSTSEKALPLVEKLRDSAKATDADLEALKKDLKTTSEKGVMNLKFFLLFQYCNSLAEWILTKFSEAVFSEKDTELNKVRIAYLLHTLIRTLETNKTIRTDAKEQLKKLIQNNTDRILSKSSNSILLIRLYSLLKIKSLSLPMKTKEIIQKKQMQDPRLYAKATAESSTAFYENGNLIEAFRRNLTALYHDPHCIPACDNISHFLMDASKSIDPAQVKNDYLTALGNTITFKDEHKYIPNSFLAMATFLAGNVNEGISSLKTFSKTVEEEATSTFMIPILPRLLLSYAFYFTRDYQAAIDHLLIITRHRPHHEFLPTILHNLGILYSLIGEIATAEHWFKEAQNYHRNEDEESAVAPKIEYSIFRLFHSNKDIEEAKAELKRQMALSYNEFNSFGDLVYAVESGHPLLPSKSLTAVLSYYNKPANRSTSTFISLDSITVAHLAMASYLEKHGLDKPEVKGEVAELCDSIRLHIDDLSTYKKGDNDLKALTFLAYVHALHSLGVSVTKNRLSFHSLQTEFQHIVKEASTQKKTVVTIAELLLDEEGNTTPPHEFLGISIEKYSELTQSSAV